jgi:hypothetical protein
MGVAIWLFAALLGVFLATIAGSWLGPGHVRYLLMAAAALLIVMLLDGSPIPYGVEIGSALPLFVVAAGACRSRTRPGAVHRPVVSKFAIGLWIVGAFVYFAGTWMAMFFE